MSECDCALEFNVLQDQVRLLEHQLQQLRYDLEREIDGRHAAVRDLANELSDAYPIAG